MSLFSNQVWKISDVALHGVAWIGVLLLPLLLEVHSALPWFDWFRILVLASIFYFHYWITVPRLYFAGRMQAFLVSIVISIGVGHALVRGFLAWSMPRPTTLPMGGHPVQGLLAILFVDLFAVAFVVLFALLLKNRARIQYEEHLRRQAEMDRIQSELDFLKLQLSPHFLFNTLNNIYSLIGIDVGRARDSVHRLGRLLRYQLYETKGASIALASEVDFLTSCIELMKLRLSSKVQVKVHFQVSQGEFAIPPMLLLPLVENAFKHGPGSGKDAFIEIELRQWEDRIQFKVYNSHDATRTPTGSQSGGVGLTNLRRRLLILLPDRHVWETEHLEKTHLETLTLFREQAHA